MAKEFRILVEIDECLKLNKPRVVSIFDSLKEMRIAASESLLPFTPFTKKIIFYVGTSSFVIAKSSFVQVIFNFLRKHMGQ